MSEELKPCPFCGGGVSIDASCNHSFMWEGGCWNDGCPVQPQVWEPTRAAAIAAWNRRTPDAQPEPAVPAVVEHDIAMNAFTDAADLVDAMSQSEANGESVALVLKYRKACLADSPPRAALNLMPVVEWMENGCDPLEAAKELRIYQATLGGPRNE